MLARLYWNELYVLQVQIGYLARVLARTERTDRGVRGFLAVTSTASAAGWAIWREWAFTWGVIIAASQVVNALRDVLPYNNPPVNAE